MVSGLRSRYQPGQVHTGRITRLAEFGAFVELEPGVEGLAHASTFAPTGRSFELVYVRSRGARRAFEILGIDTGEEADQPRARTGGLDARRRCAVIATSGRDRGRARVHRT